MRIIIKAALLVLSPALSILGPVVPAARAQAKMSRELQDIDNQLQDSDTVEKSYGAMALQHFARNQWGFALFNHAEQRDWQRSLAPLLPDLVAMLGLDEPLEWTDPNGNAKQTTTPRNEATLALLAVERAAVDPLIAALDKPKLAGPADEVLRALVHGGPPEHDRPGWHRWWDAHRKEPLHNEHGQWWVPALVVALLAGMGAVVFRLQRDPKR